MPRRKLTDQEIIQGFRDGDEHITRDYFYGYCQIAYNLYDSRYQLSSKPGLDFYSLSHKYYLDLILHQFVQLEDHSRRVSLKTWMIKGFLFVIWETIREYNKEYGRRKGMPNVPISDVSPKGPVNSEDFNQAIEDICVNILHNGEPECKILRMILIEGYKSIEVAEMLHISPSAVSQRYRKLRDKIVLPYLKRHLYVA